MKCKQCGNNLTIDDASCPFCGMENPFAKEHRKQMEHYKQEFETTKDSVETRTRIINRLSTRVAVIAILVAANFVFFIMSTAFSYDIRSFVWKGRVQSRLSKHMQTMESLEEERAFSELSYYYTYHNLEKHDKFDEYDAVAQVSRCYSDFYMLFMDVIVVEKADYSDTMELLGRAMDAVERMYYWSEKKEYGDPKRYAKEHQECMDAAIEEMKLMIRQYCHLTEEEMADFEKLSTAQREVLVGKGLGIYE